MTLAQKIACLVVAMASACFSTCKVQDWRMGKKLAEQASQHKDDLAAITNADADQSRAEQYKRLATE